MTVQLQKDLLQHTVCLEILHDSKCIHLLILIQQKEKNKEYFIIQDRTYIQNSNTTLFKF